MLIIAAFKSQPQDAEACFSENLSAEVMLKETIGQHSKNSSHFLFHSYPPPCRMGSACVLSPFTTSPHISALTFNIHISHAFNSHPTLFEGGGQRVT